jgi:hypothetical protein
VDLSPGQMPLGRKRTPSPESMMPLVVTGSNEIGHFGLPNKTIRFAQFSAGASGSCLFHVRTHFGDSARESNTSSMSSMKGGNSNNNGSDLNNGNIIKPTFNTSTEEGRKAFNVYRTNLEELLLSHCEVT